MSAYKKRSCIVVSNSKWSYIWDDRDTNERVLLEANMGYRRENFGNVACLENMGYTKRDHHRVAMIKIPKSLKFLCEVTYKWLDQITPLKFIAFIKPTYW